MHELYPHLNDHQFQLELLRIENMRHGGGIPLKRMQADYWNDRGMHVMGANTLQDIIRTGHPRLRVNYNHSNALDFRRKNVRHTLLHTVSRLEGIECMDLQSKTLVTSFHSSSQPE